MINNVRNGNIKLKEDRNEIKSMDCITCCPGFGTGLLQHGPCRKGMAVFVHATGGLMYEATIGGQKFSYTPNK